MSTMTNETIIKKFLAGEEINNNGTSANVVALFKLGKGSDYGQFIEGEKYQCINAVMLNEETDKLFVSGMSIAGVIYGSALTKEAVKEHNASQLFKGGRIEEVIFRDGSSWTFDIEDEANM